MNVFRTYVCDFGALGAGPPWKLAGIDAFMGKPVNAGQLTDMLVQLQRELNERYAAVEQGRRADDSLVSHPILPTTSTNPCKCVMHMQCRVLHPLQAEPSSRIVASYCNFKSLANIPSFGLLNKYATIIPMSSPAYF